jgi:chloramphenicol O-acetyltransferase type A
MSYEIVDAYYRQAQFDFFRQQHSPFYSLTFELECTAVEVFAKERGYSTYLNLCYFLTKAMQPLEDFRYRLLDGKIVLYHCLHFGMTVPAPGGLFSFCNFEHNPDTEAFNAIAKGRMEKSQERAKMEALGRPNEVHFTAIPEIPFTSFTHVPPNDPSDGAIKVAFGQFLRQGQRTKVPVALQVNHIFIDGAALGRLATATQALYSNPS